MKRWWVVRRYPLFYAARANTAAGGDRPDGTRWDKAAASLAPLARCCVPLRHQRSL